MTKYGEAAVRSVNAIISNEGKDPRDIWDFVTSEIFGEGTCSQRKGCPRNTFLALCEEGLIKGIKKGNYTRSQKNKEYALKAVKVLKENPNLTKDAKALWREVVDEPKAHNGQMDVVIALWNNGYIDRE
ncbi:DUF6979 family protein [Methanococcoides sp. FTZ1]|uniref:DUF6979 family protein n=1 Tax=Methanococcoides sp. FTZ1 TaxID=3439061 RepID=UPI003F866177